MPGSIRVNTVKKTPDHLILKPLYRYGWCNSFLEISLVPLLFIQVDEVSDGEEAKPDDDDENILTLESNEAKSDLLGCDTETAESANLLAGPDAHVDQLNLLGQEGEGMGSNNGQNRNLLDF